MSILFQRSEFTDIMTSNSDLQNSLLSLASSPDWVFTIDFETAVLHSLYESGNLPDSLSAAVKAAALCDLEQFLQQIISEPAEDLSRALSLQVISSEILLKPYRTPEFSLSAAPADGISFRFSYLNEQQIAGALYYRHPSAELAEYFL